MTRGRGESGFSLVEVLAAISILAVISYPLTEAVIQAVTTTDGTATRYAESIDAQTFAASFVTDVQSSDTVQVPGPAVDDPCTDPSVQPVLRLQWTDGVVVKTATYTAEARTGKERRLTRRYCEKKPDELPTLVRQHAVASFLSDEPEPVPACEPAPCSPDADAPPPRTVTLALTDNSGYRYQLTGTRRPS